MVAPSPLPLPPGYTLRRATLRDLRALYRLERLIFRDAYPYFDLALLFLTPGVINLKIAAPDGSLAAFVCATRGLARDRAWIVTLGVSPAHQRRGRRRRCWPAPKRASGGPASV